ncbi:MAG: TIGR01777 family oxidoreductase [Synechococcaceae cyanobacterium]|nr:TIGR01777 family oxidoreductase [Synechococcaceae cyanobacterium]
MRLLLLGCSGFVGRELVPYLLQLGHDLTVLSRAPQPAGLPRDPRLQLLRGDPADPATWRQQGLQQALAAAEGVVNLVGEPIAEKRWTAAHRQLLRDSRVRSTSLLVAAMAALPNPPAVLVNGSAVGFYGSSEQASFDESSPAGDDLLARLCLDWEAAAQAAAPASRVVILRLGIVLAADGGALGRMLPVFRLGLGGPVGNGQQWLSWVHRTDVCRLIATALEEASYRGVYNVVAPRPVRMRELSQTLGEVLGRPSLLPVPAPLLQVLLGDGAKVVLEGQRVRPQRLEDQGFSFQFPELRPALVAATSPGPR